MNLRESISFSIIHSLKKTKMIAAASRYAVPTTSGSGNRVRSLLTASCITTCHSIPTKSSYRYRISFINRQLKPCPSSIFSIKCFLSNSASSSNSRASFSTDDGSLKNQKTASTVAKSPPGGGQIADIKILKSLVSYLWMKDNLEFQLRVVAATFLLVGAKVSYIVANFFTFFIIGAYGNK